MPVSGVVGSVLASDPDGASNGVVCGLLGGVEGGGRKEGDGGMGEGDMGRVVVGGHGAGG